MSDVSPRPDHRLTIAEKALAINVDARRYGTFAEIGAGQEVARWFFHVGGAAGTVAKTISAYDMTVSDAIYGPTDRYVSRRRLQAMLQHEFDLLLERLAATRGDKCTFFVFANTVATRSFSRKEEGHGWLGIRFQTEPHGPPSEIIIHVRLLEKENVRQQEALGAIGVNLIHGAFYHYQSPETLVRSLLDDLTWERVEVDMISTSGPAFAGVDDRLLSLQLVTQGLTEAAMFTADGEPVQWSEVLHKKPVLVQRGSFRPVTNATLDVLERARERFLREPALEGESPAVLMEMTLRQLTTGEAIDHADFLQRADLLGALGHTVLISNFRRFHRLAAYLARYTSRPLGLAVGASKLAEIFNESLYNDAEGGLLGGLGQLFKNDSRLYVYPIYHFASGRISTAENFAIPDRLRHIYQHFRENECIQDVQPSNPDFLRIRSQDVLDRIAARDPAWETLVPPPIVAVIKAKQLFGCA
jgi:hypothetical protein